MKEEKLCEAIGNENIVNADNGLVDMVIISKNDHKHYKSVAIGAAAGAAATATAATVAGAAAIGAATVAAAPIVAVGAAAAAAGKIFSWLWDD